MAKRRTHPELVALMKQARSAAKGSEPRKHHLVPASYLRRWAADGQVRVSHIDERRSYTTAPDKAARETDFYRMEHELLDPEDMPPLLMEALLGRLEGSAKRSLDILMTKQPWTLDDELRGELEWHIAFQLTRGRSFRAENHRMLNELYRAQYKDVPDAEIIRRLREAGDVATPEAVAQQRAFLDDLQSGDLEFRRAIPQEVGMAAKAAASVVGHLAARHWVVFDTRPVLVTCDEPVVPVGGPGCARDERAGIATAGVILFPLSPQRLLAMFHRELEPRGPLALDGIETAEVNLEILSSSFRWAFELPSRAVTRHWMFPAEQPVMTSEGPLADWEGAGDLYRHYKRTRWAHLPQTPWPVLRWW
jgi:hypothetical protein